uniref:Uncharacterized protein n=1 Tax=Ditylenchus dipsaci TaxID=166011 RepID=A0A915CMP0_9BILA
MSVSESNDYFEKAKKERQRKLSADNIGNFLDLGDLAAWNMKAVIVPRRKPHRHNADPPTHKDPFIEIPSNKAVKNLSQPQRYLLRRGSAAAEIRLPDRQQRRVSAQPEQYCAFSTGGQSTEVEELQNGGCSRAGYNQSLESAAPTEKKLSRRKLLEKERRTFGNDSKLICRSPSQKQLQEELRGHTTHWQDQGRIQEKIKDNGETVKKFSGKSLITIFRECLQRKQAVYFYNKTCNGGKGCCEVCGDELDQANGNHNLSQVAQQISIIPRQAISITAPEAMPLMPNNELNNRRRAESHSSEMFKSNIF